MRRTMICATALALLALGLTAHATYAEDAAPEAPPPGLDADASYTATYRAMRRFDVDLPTTVWQTLGETLDFRAGGGPEIAVERAEGQIRFDRDGDGEAESTLGGDSAFHVFKRKKLGWRMALRFRKAATGWQYACSGAQRFRIELAGGEKTYLMVFDADGNGRYGDLGRDAMVVGTSKSAWPFSRTVHLPALGDKPVRVELAASGQRLRLVQDVPALGRLDLRSDFVSRGRLLAARVTSSDGQHSFDLAHAEQGLLVPAGTYRLHSATVGLGADRVRAIAGRAQPMTVAADKTTRWAWGGPLRGEFGYDRQGMQVVFQPNRLAWYGRAGEAWVDWTPFGDSPVFIVRGGQAGADGIRPEIARAVFCGT